MIELLSHRASHFRSEGVERRRVTTVRPSGNTAAEVFTDRSPWRERRLRLAAARRVAAATFPPIVVISLLFVGIVRFLDLVSRAHYAPNPPRLPNVAALDAFWRFWDGNDEGLSLRGAVTLVSVLLIIMLWLKWRDHRLAHSGGFLALLPYLGTALLLAHLQIAIVGISKVESNYRLIPIADDASLRQFFTETRRD